MLNDEEIEKLERLVDKHESDFRTVSKMISDLEDNRIAIVRQLTSIKNILKESE